MATARLALATQTKGTANWHTPLEVGFQAAEDRLTVSGAANPNGVTAGHWVGQRYWETDVFAWWVCSTATGSAGTSVWIREIPAGRIRMFTGVGAAPGWAICNGSGGTPDLRGRFIVGQDPADPDYDIVGDVGGVKTHSLIPNNIPQITTSAAGAHTHAVKTFGDGDVGNVHKAGAAAGTDAATEISADHAHVFGNAIPIPVDHRPPFYTLAFEVKL